MRILLKILNIFTSNHCSNTKLKSVHEKQISVSQYSAISLSLLFDFYGCLSNISPPAFSFIEKNVCIVIKLPRILSFNYSTLKYGGNLPEYFKSNINRIIYHSLRTCTNLKKAFSKKKNAFNVSMHDTTLYYSRFDHFTSYNFT